MKTPQKPPDFSELHERVKESGRFGELLHVAGDPTSDRKYLHWDKLRYRSPPAGLSCREWWYAIKLRRLALLKPLPLVDVDGRPFLFAIVDPILELLQLVDQSLAGRIETPDAILSPDTRDRYLISSLVEEAITSSQLEGAATTRQVAKEMIRTGRRPRDRSERMMLNNYLTMQRVGRLRKESLTRDLVFDIHRTVTEGTFDDPSAAGRCRRSGEQVMVADHFGEVLHRPPPADQLEDRMRTMCAFANGKTPDYFVHPVVRSILLHFWLAYDHPFVDGNGRTARALFYWSMLRQKYWLCEFISISRTGLAGPAKYGRAFHYAETDDNDVTYFLLYHLRVIRRAIRQLNEYIERKTKRLAALERELRGMGLLNHRQRALVTHALRHPYHQYTIESHRRSHDVVYQTARTDLLDLAERGFLDAKKLGRTWHFTPVANLEEKLRQAP